MLHTLPLYSQFVSLPIKIANVETVLQDGGHVLGIEEIYIVITDIFKEEKYNTYKISGYVENAYMRENTNDTFDISIYDSVQAEKLRKNMFQYQDSLFPINKFCSYNHGMFTVYLQKHDVAEVTPRFFAYPVRIYIRD